MNIRKTMTIVVAAISMATFAKGVYFVSGGDFRKWDLKYTLRTTEANQTIAITPEKLKTLSTVSPDFEYPWSLKSEGTEYEFGYFDNIGMSATDLNSRGASNVPPFQVTFQNAGNHSIKMYNTKGNVFRIWFQDNPYIKELYVNWENFAPVTGTTRQGPSLYINNCTNLVKFVYNNPTNLPENNARRKLDNWAFAGLPSATEFQIVHPEFYREIGQRCFATNGMYTVNFPGVTNIQEHAFDFLPNATNVYLPNLEIAGTWCFMGAYYVKTIRLSEKVRVVKDNAMYNTMKRIKVNGVARSEEGGTIEFITSASDFVAAWNNHPVLPKWFGPAVAIEGNDHEATLLPFTGKRGSSGERPAYYFVNDNFPKPTRLVRIQPEE